MLFCTMVVNGLTIFLYTHVASLIPSALLTYLSPSLPYSLLTSVTPSIYPSIPPSLLPFLPPLIQGLPTLCWRMSRLRHWMGTLWPSLDGSAVLKRCSTNWAATHCTNYTSEEFYIVMWKVSYRTQGRAMCVL